MPSVVAGEPVARQLAYRGSDLEWTQWLPILKTYGPVVGIFIGFIIWQSIQITKLLDRNETAYKGEIERMSKQMDKLMEHVLGKQPSSQSLPSIKDAVNDAEKKTRELPSGKTGEKE